MFQFYFDVSPMACQKLWDTIIYTRKLLPLGNTLYLPFFSSFVWWAGCCFQKLIGWTAVSDMKSGMWAKRQWYFRDRQRCLLKVIHQVTSLKVRDEFLIEGKCLLFNLTAFILAHHKVHECYWEPRENEMKNHSIYESLFRNPVYIAVRC